MLTDHDERAKPEGSLNRRAGAPFLPLRFLLVFWLFVLSAVAFLDRTNISIAGVQIAREFGLDNIHLGWVFSSFLVGYAVFQVPGGALAQRLGPRRVLTLGVVWWGVFTALTALVPSQVRGALWIMMIVRFLLGAGEATMYPATNSFIERWVPLNERGKANGLIFAGVGFGSGVTPPLVTAIVLHYGWRASFWFSAVVGIAVGLFWYLVARDTPEEHPGITAGELERIVRGRGDAVSAGQAAISPPSPSRKPATPWAKIFSSKESPRAHRELFRLLLCGLDFLQLVLYLPGAGARIESEVQRDLLNAAFCRNDRRVFAGRGGQRLACTHPWAAARALLALDGCAGFHRGSSGFGLARSRGHHRQSDSGLRGRRFVCVAELLLVDDRRHRGRVFRRRFGNDEHGRTDRRSRHRFAHADNRRALRLGSLFPDRRYPRSIGRLGLAGGRSGCPACLTFASCLSMSVVLMRTGETCFCFSFCHSRKGICFTLSRWSDHWPLPTDN